MTLRFTVLGPIEVSVGGRALPGLAPRHRAVLGYLLLNAGRVVSADRLIDAVWGLTPPDSARAQIHAAITAIRRVLRAAGAAELLGTRPAGYVISPGTDQLDLDEFTTRVTSATAGEIRAALELWRDEAFSDVTADYVPDARARLEERRLSAIERLAEMELEHGRHEDLIDELTGLVAAHPLRARLTSQLMLALHRSGRQADALAAARTFRSALAEQQGLDPNRSFLALEEAILRDDAGLYQPAVLAPEPPEPESTAVRRARFLPYDTSDFAGRTDELAWLTRIQPGVMTLAAVDGMAGIGKTTLAIHAAYRLADRFPDGQLFVDLHGHTAGQPPLEAGAALEILLRQLGVPNERIPVSVTERSALWRAELTGRRVLAVLDNAAGTDHVRPLLPGASFSLILITSRRQLTDLDGAQALSVDLLPAADAVAMFTGIVGARAEAEPLAVLDVLQLCGFLPLAVRIAAARLRHRPRWTVAYLADRLRDQRRRLAELTTSERGVAVAFNLSYEQLDPAQRRMFRLLGLHPGRDIDANAAAALADVPADAAEDLLEGLLDAHVLRQQEPARYTFHDLLRVHARTTTLATEPPAEQQAALTRLAGHYLYAARLAVDVLFDYGKDRLPHVPVPDRPILSFSSEAETTAWLDAERANLLAIGGHTAEHGPPITGDLATTLRPYLDARGHPSDALSLHTHALHASRRLGDTASEVTALVDLGWLGYRLGDHDKALADSKRALELSLEIGDRYTASRALNTIGNVYLRKREYPRVHEHLEHALTLSRQIGNQVGEAHVLSNLAISYQQQGRPDQASDHHRQALQLHQRIGNRGGEARTLDHLGVVYRSQGHHEQARDHHRQALQLYRLLGNRSEQASALNGLGEVACATDQPGQAVSDHEAARALAVELGNRPEQARAEHGLADAHRALGHPDTAREHAQRALDLYTGIDVPDADDIRRLLANLDQACF